MKIAVATDDKVRVRKGYFGRSAYFRVIEILNGVIVGAHNRINPYAADAPDPPGTGSGQAFRIIELLHDCELFMGTAMAKEALPVLNSRKIDCIVTDVEQVDAAVEAYLDGKDEHFKYYDPGADCFKSCAERK